MAVEIERKFLIDPAWQPAGEGVRYRQGYLSTDPACSVRVRLAGVTGWLTIKGATVGITREEYEYPIPAADADAMLDRLCRQPLIEKTRYKVELDGLLWEIDVFEGANAGLRIAEVELSDERQRLQLPPWVRREVTDDVRYYNASLAERPYRDWADADH
ncbi:MAG: CYTH domain-containing protein [Pseudomonadota bacterium]